MEEIKVASAKYMPQSDSMQYFLLVIGHIKVLYAGILGNVCRFLYISWLKNPFWVLPFEFVQGKTVRCSHLPTVLTYREHFSY